MKTAGTKPGGFYCVNHMMAFEMTSPIVSNVAAQTKADTKFANWNCQNGISKMPAIRGTEARNGPKNRPMKIPTTPHFFMKASARGMSSGWRDSGHMCATVYSSFSPIQYDSQSPNAAPTDAEIQIGQKLMPLCPIKAPIATSAPQAGIR